MQTQAQLNVTFLLLDGFSNLVLASFLEPLRDVTTRLAPDAVQWRLCSLSGGPVQSSSRLAIGTSGAVSDQERQDIFVIVAGYGVRAVNDTELHRDLRRIAQHSGQVVGLDSAAWLLAQAGLLAGRKATIHWQELDLFRETFPAVQVSTQRFVRSGRFLTCGGASTALDLSLSLIREHFGPAVAFEASSMFLYNSTSQMQMNRGAGALRKRAHPAVLAALNLMADHVETPLSLAQIAARANVSERTLTRLFRADLDMTPGQCYQHLRLQRARDLAQETTLSVAQIALRCGFSTAPALSRAFTARYHTTIGTLRQK